MVQKSWYLIVGVTFIVFVSIAVVVSSHLWRLQRCGAHLPKCSAFSNINCTFFIPDGPTNIIIWTHLWKRLLIFVKRADNQAQLPVRVSELFGANYSVPMRKLGQSRNIFNSRAQNKTYLHVNLIILDTRFYFWEVNLVVVLCHELWAMWHLTLYENRWKNLSNFEFWIFHRSVQSRQIRQAISSQQHSSIQQLISVTFSN